VIWIVFVVVGLSAVGLVLLLLPRFTPRAPGWAESFVPPRYRRSRRARQAAAAEQPEAASGAEEPRVPVGVGVSGVNGATAVGARSRFPDRDRAGSRR
jgi:UDP-GlcNAc:undecaprenyl-phosphate GlcNAc-1-phosphate transferase